MLVHALSIAAFVVVSFTVQGASHFALARGHFNSIGFAREDPILPLGIGVMVVQGLIVSLALAAWRGGDAKLVDGVVVSLVFGAFLVLYVALVEPAKYAVPSVAAWVRVEALAGLLQFAVFGALLGLIHSRFG